MKSTENQKVPVIIVTGMSGGGRGFVLKTLEDMGYVSVDNLPLSLLGSFLKSSQDLPRPVVIGVDVRAHDFSNELFLQQIDRLSAIEDLQLDVLFCDCDDDILAQRYKETRRRHPLAHDRPVLEGIQMERRILTGIRHLATFMLDTSRLKITETRQIIMQKFRLPSEESPLFIQIMSFGFRHGIPREADQIYDVRFFQNPFYQKELRGLTGQDAPVQDFLTQDPLCETFLETVATQLNLMIPRFEEESRSYFILGFGCTGGQHRSVFCAEHMSKILGKTHNITILHRDMATSQKRSKTSL